MNDEERNFNLLMEIKRELHENNLNTNSIRDSVDYIKKKIHDHEARLKCLENEALLIVHTNRLAKWGVGVLVSLGMFVLSLVTIITNR